MASEPEEPKYVVVPAYPAVSGEQRDIRFELRAMPDGSPAGVAFTTVERLVEQLGRFQPWLILETSGYRALLARTEVRHIALDPTVDPDTVHWSAEAVRELMEVNEHGGL